VKSLISETLATWREAERVLSGLLPEADEREELRELVAELRLTYRRLSRSEAASDEAFRAAHDAIIRTTEVLDRVGGSPPNA
jgi:hypothetical protein